MNFTKLALTAIASLGLLAASPAAFAIPFSVTAATQTVGAGYGIDLGPNPENGGTLLDVRFTNSFLVQNFSLDAVNPSYTFTIGTVQFAETDAGGNNAGIRAGETNLLNVSWTFTFADPVSGNQLLSIPAFVDPGSVSDSDVDYKLDWSNILVGFGDGGKFLISLNDLSFSNVGEPEKAQTATITLLALPTVTSPLVGQDVPEPASLALMGLALAGLAVTRRRKQASS